jgi:hypothetical protein
MFPSAAAVAVRAGRDYCDQQTQKPLVPCLRPRRRTSCVNFSLWVPPKRNAKLFASLRVMTKLLRRTLDHSNFSCKDMTDCVRFSRAAFLPINSESTSKLGSHMTLRASLLREFVNPNLSVGRRSEAMLRISRETLRTEANMRKHRNCLVVCGRSLGERPNLEGLDEAPAAEVLLRARSADGRNRE